MKQLQEFVETRLPGRQSFRLNRAAAYWLLGAGLAITAAYNSPALFDLLSSGQLDSRPDTGSSARTQVLTPTVDEMLPFSTVTPTAREAPLAPPKKPTVESLFKIPTQTPEPRGTIIPINSDFSK